jgi:flagellin
MGLKINQNIFSMLVQRNLGHVTSRLEQSYERISSGERINRSADDPSGLAASEQLRHEIHGIRQNQQNVAGAFSLVRVAESQLDNVNNLLQRSRELAIQASNDTLDADSRAAIQNEMTQIVDEINRIAETSRYNNLNLFDGSMVNRCIQIGTTSSESISLTLSDLRQNVLGVYVNVTGTNPVSLVPITGGGLQINGVVVPDSTADAYSLVFSDASAVAKANAINSIESQTGVHAEPEPTFFTGLNPVNASTLDGVSNFISINGVNLGLISVMAGDSDNSMIDAINDQTNVMGVKAIIDGSGRLQLTAEDGRNIRIEGNGTAVSQLGIVAGPGLIDCAISAEITLRSNEAILLEGDTPLLGFLGTPLLFTPDPAMAIQFLNVGDHDMATDALNTIDAALGQISDSRSRLGALYNRLESLNDSLARQVEDFGATDSRIRDTDFAFETARLTQAQILQDAGIAMLTQANLSPRRALNFL